MWWWPKRSWPRWSGLPNPTVHRILTALREQGVLDTGYRKLLIVDRLRLAQLADP